MFESIQYCSTYGHQIVTHLHRYFPDPACPFWGSSNLVAADGQNKWIKNQVKNNEHSGLVVFKPLLCTSYIGHWGTINLTIESSAHSSFGQWMRYTIKVKSDCIKVLCVINFVFWSKSINNKLIYHQGINTPFTNIGLMSHLQLNQCL